MEIGAHLPPPLALRPAQPNDLDLLFSLHTAAMRQYVTQIWGWDEAFQAELYRRNFHPEGVQIILAEGREIGMLAMEDQADQVFLRNIEILPQYQRRGIGSILLRIILKEAGRLRKPVALRVLKPNPARELYERLGFSQVGETPTHYLMSTSLLPQEQAP